MTESISHPFIVIVIISKKLLQILLKCQYPLTPDQRQTLYFSSAVTKVSLWGGEGEGGGGDCQRQETLVAYI